MPWNRSPRQRTWLLAPEDRALLGRVRAFAKEKIAPIIDQYWGRAEFPFELIPHHGALGIAGVGYHGYGCNGTREINSLVVGRAITGFGAFV
jgi:hypothetical protein